MAGDKDDRDVDVGLGQVALKLEPAHIRQPHVEHQACRRLRTLAPEKLVRRSERLHPQAYGGNELSNGDTDRLIVVNHKYNRIGIRGHAVPRQAGSVK
jgi:hypothetical protein